MASSTEIQVKYIFTADYSRMAASFSAVSKAIEKEGEEAGDNTGKKFGKGWTIAVSALQTVTSKVFSGVYNAIASNVDRAVDRVDTMNAFPKVMKNFGVSGKEAEKSIKRIDKAVQGLPTSLDDAVSGVQDIFMVTKDLPQAESMFKAINDSAMIFAKGSSEAVNRFAYAYKQSLASGKVDAANFRQMNEAIPGIMDKIAESMGMSVQEMKEGLSDGSVSVEEFNKAFVKLDKEGGAGMESLEKAAKDSTGGIKTTMKNMNTAITRGISETIEAIGQENIEAIAKGIGDAIENIGKALANVIKFVKDNKDWLLPVLGIVGILAAVTVGLSKAGKAVKIFKNTWGGVGKAIGGIFGKTKKPKMDADTLLGGDPKKTLADTFKNLGNTIKAFGEPLRAALDVLKQVLVGAAEAIVEPIKVIFKGVGEAIAGFFTAFANPAIAVGAAMFAVAAAAVAAAILLIGGAIALTMPAWERLFNNIVMPFATFIRETVLMMIDNLTNNIIKLTTKALIPLGNFLLAVFVIAVKTVTDAIIRLTNKAVIPLVNALSGAFTRVIKSISDLINNTLKTALEGVKGIIDSVGNAFTKMGKAIRNALDGVSGILKEFRGIIESIGAAIIGVVALATGQSINYGKGFAHVTKAALGGRVFGVGSSTSDSNLYALSKGEYVVRASAAKSIGYDALDYMNTTGRVSDMNNGNVTVNQYNTVNTPVDMQIINQRLGNAVRRATA